jgi:hypothetical protein
MKKRAKRQEEKRYVNIIKNQLKKKDKNLYSYN